MTMTVQSRIHRSRRVSFSGGGSIISGYNSQTSRPGRRSERRGIIIHARTYVASTLIAEIAGKECPPVWMRLPTSRRLKIWDAIKEPVVPLWRNLHGHPFYKTALGKQIGRGTIETNGKHVSTWECPLHPQKIATMLVRKCRRPQDGWNGGLKWNFCEKISIWRTQPLLERIKKFGVAVKH